jgi:hypothetical protein
MCNKIISKSLQNPAMFFLSPKIRGKSPQTCTLISNRSYLSPQKTKIEGTSPKNKLQQGSTRAPKFERLLKAPHPSFLGALSQALKQQLLSFPSSTAYGTEPRPPHRHLMPCCLLRYRQRGSPPMNPSPSVAL